MNRQYDAYLNSWRHSGLGTMSEIPVTPEQFKNLSYIQRCELKQKHPELYSELLSAVKAGR